MPLRDTWMRLLHATRMRRKSLRDAGHHFVYRLSTCSGYRNQVATGCLARSRSHVLCDPLLGNETDEIGGRDGLLEPTHSARPTPMATKRSGVVADVASLGRRYDRRSVAKDRRHSAKLRGRSICREE